MTTNPLKNRVVVRLSDSDLELLTGWYSRNYRGSHTTPSKIVVQLLRRVITGIRP